MNTETQRPAELAAANGSAVAWPCRTMAHEIYEALKTARINLELSPEIAVINVIDAVLLSNERHQRTIPAPMFVAWQCEKCGRYHHKHFPDEGCDWCNGAAISKRMGLTPQNAALCDPAHGDAGKPKTL